MNKQPKPPSLTPAQIVWGRFYRVLLEEASKLRAMMNAAESQTFRAQDSAAGSPPGEAEQQPDFRPAPQMAQMKIE